MNGYIITYLSQPMLKATPQPAITAEVAQQILDVVDEGLVHGLGRPEPGAMCVEAAVCFAMGEGHGDRPSCVDSALRDFKIGLNDSAWASKAARARGLRRIAIAQLGTRDRFDRTQFSYAISALAAQLVPSLTFRDTYQRTYLDRRAKELFGADRHTRFNAAHAVLEAAAESAERNPPTGVLPAAAGDRVRSDFAEAAVQVLIAMNTEGSKFLYLTEPGYVAPSVEPQPANYSSDLY